MAAASRHGDFKEKEASRPQWTKNEFTMTQVKKPEWEYGDGANDGGESLKKGHVQIDPYEPGREIRNNYRLLISAIVPRPIGFVSTQSKDGQSSNLAPFSYTQVMSHDPPLFVVGIAGGIEKAKDTLRNIIDTKECVINLISEHFIEAANSCAVPAPHGVSEWVLSGLTPAECTTVKCSRVKEAVFAVEGHLVDFKEYASKVDPNKKTVTILTIEGTRFWAREDAIDEEKTLIDFNVYKPLARLGGITYARQLEGFELQRPGFEESTNNPKAQALIKPKHPAQI